jgi:two-component system, response regulator
LKEGAIEILLVEDNPNDVELALHSFKRYNITNQILVARDGAEALDYLFGRSDPTNESLPKVVLLDLKLPKVDGLEVLEAIRANPKTHSLPVVVLTSSHDDRDIEECYRLGANSYIVKPVDFQQFTESVRQLGMYWLLLNEPPKPV